MLQGGVRELGELVRQAASGELGAPGPGSSGLPPLHPQHHLLPGEWGRCYLLLTTCTAW
jgi:hypothetical protein